MFHEPGGMPIAGGVMFAGLLYAGASMFITGPVIGERTIEKSGWPATCASQIRANVEADKPAPPIRLPNLCGLIFGIYGRDGAAYCDMHGHHFDNPANKILGGIEEQKRKVHERRLAHAASKAGSRCECAVTTTLEAQRVPLALYAGSLRLVTPPSVKALSSELTTALNSPRCAMKG